MKIENEFLFKECLKKPINLFLGAGFSVNAFDKNNKHLPIGAELANELRGKFCLEKLSDLDLGRLCTIINRTHSEELREYLIERFSVSTYDQNYKIIKDKLNIDSIFSVNIDNLIQIIYEGSNDKFINDIDVSGPQFRNVQAIDLVMLHGSVVNSYRPLRFGSTEVASSFSQDPDRWYLLQSKIKKTTTIFWGCSLYDAPILEALIPMTSSYSQIPPAWILVYPSSNTDSDIEYFKALNFNIITGETNELLEYINCSISEKDEQKHYSIEKIYNIYKANTIPKPGSVASRPIIEFFRGAAPMWSDIYSQ